MNSKIEEEIVRCFIQKNRQDRIIWELQSKRKRDSVMWKLCDTHLFKREVLYPQRYLSPENLTEKLEALGAQKTIYMIAFDEMYELDCSVLEGIERQTSNPYLLYYGSGLGYFEGMQEDGAPERCILISVEDQARLKKYKRDTAAYE